MNITFPIRLDEPVFDRANLVTPLTSIDGTEDFDFADAHGDAITVSGWDSSAHISSRGTRLTNLTGIRRGELLKLCPRCKRIKSHDLYGDSGRTTDCYRDQSNCIACRNDC